MGYLKRLNVIIMCNFLYLENMNDKNILEKKRIELNKRFM